MSTDMKILTVVPLRKGPLGQNLTYFSAQNVSPGMLVNIPLRNKQILGLVAHVEDVNNIKADVKNMDFSIRKIADVKETSIFPKEFFEAALDMSTYFASTPNNTITSLIPNIFREHYDEIAESFTKENHGSHEVIGSVRSEKLIFQAPLEERISAYKTLIRSSFAEKKSVFIILPTEYDIKSFHHFLSRGIEQFTFDLYSGQGTKKILSKIKGAIETKHPILVLGTPPFLSLPRRDFKTLILEHESSNSYRKLERPFLDQRIFAELFASKMRAKFILSDTLLSFHTLFRHEAEDLSTLSPMSFRTIFEGDIEILPRGKPTPDVLTKGEKKFKVLLPECEEKIKEYIDKKKNVFIFALRKGMSTSTICRDCGETLSCGVCASPVVLYISKDGSKRMFSCNRCKIGIDPNTKCGSCDSWNLMPLGIGTDTVYEEIRKIFGKEKILQLDKETAKNKKGALEIAQKFEKSEGAILIGTEMSFSYLKNKIPLSIVASFDSLWSIPSYAMGEKIVHILLSILEKTSKNLLIQTKNEQDGAILAVKNSNILSFVREELDERQKLAYPPFKRFIKISHLGDREEKEWARNMLRELFKDYNPEIFSGFITRLAGKYTTNAIIKIDPKNWSLPEIMPGSTIDSNLRQILSSLPTSFEISVDPEDLL